MWVVQHDFFPILGRQRHNVRREGILGGDNKTGRGEKKISKQADFHPCRSNTRSRGKIHNEIVRHRKDLEWVIVSSSMNEIFKKKSFDSADSLVMHEQLKEKKKCKSVIGDITVKYNAVRIMTSRRALNPAFASAHGLAASEDDDVIMATTTKVSSGSKRLELLLKEAMATGKLHASNAGLKSPLPESIFDVRAGIVVDLSMNVSKGSVDVFAFAEETLTSVDLSDNDLHGSELDQRVLRYQQVQVLRWKRCGLMAMNVNLSSLEHLVVLDLAGNQLEEFHLDFLPIGLQELNLANNQLRELSSREISLDHLVSIDLSENKLDSLSIRVSWPRLQCFICPRNKLKELKCLESAKDSLQTLIAAHNQLESGALNLSNFTQLQTVLLSFNRLTAVPCIPLTVTKLDLTTNRIESIQGLFVANRSETPVLVELLLQDNYLTELDATVIATCTKLQRLDLSSNKLKNLPYQLGFLAHLRFLTVTGNPLFTFKDFELVSCQALLEKLRNRAPKSEETSTRKTLLLSSSVLRNNRSIHLSNKTNIDLQQLLSELQASPTLTFDISQLTLNKNNLEHLPQEILSLLPNLIELSLCGNAFRSLPISLASSCHKLTRLIMTHNAITQIDDLFQASNPPWAQTLTQLDLSSNRLTQIPGGIWKGLPNLQVLSLSFNQLKSVHDWDWLPPTLTQLNLSENALEQVTELILVLGAYCPNLEKLWLQQNYLTCIPFTIGMLQERCPNLKVLDLKGNPQHAIRPEILARGTMDQLEYLRNRMTKEQVSHATSQFEGLSRGEEKVQDEEQERISGSNVSTVSVNATSYNEPTIRPPPVVSPEANEIGNVETMLSSLRIKISEFENELERPSLSEAKRYAVKKSLAMERSKLIREERKLGLRK